MLLVNGFIAVLVDKYILHWILALSQFDIHFYFYLIFSEELIIKRVGLNFWRGHSELVVLSTREELLWERASFIIKLQHL